MAQMVYPLTRRMLLPISFHLYGQRRSEASLQNMVSGFNWMSPRWQEFILSSIQKMRWHSCSPPSGTNHQLSNAYVLRSCHLPQRSFSRPTATMMPACARDQPISRTCLDSWLVFCKIPPWLVTLAACFLRKIMNTNEKRVPFLFGSQIYDGFLKNWKRRTDFTSWGSHVFSSTRGVEWNVPCLEHVEHVTWNTLYCDSKIKEQIQDWLMSSLSKSPWKPKHQSCYFKTVRHKIIKTMCLYKRICIIFYYILLFSMIDTNIYQQIFRAYR